MSAEPLAWTEAAVSTGAQDAAAWHRLVEADSAEQLCAAWLAVLCRELTPVRSGLVLLAVAFAPVMLKKLKPIGKKIAETMVKAGEKLMEYVEEAPAAVAEVAPKVRTGTEKPPKAASAAKPKEEPKVASQRAAEKSPEKPKAAATKAKATPKPKPAKPKAAAKTAGAAKPKAKPVSKRK